MHGAARVEGASKAAKVQAQKASLCHILGHPSRVAADSRADHRVPRDDGLCRQKGGATHIDQPGQAKGGGHLLGLPPGQGLSGSDEHV